MLSLPVHALALLFYSVTCFAHYPASVSSERLAAANKAFIMLTQPTIGHFLDAVEKQLLYQSDRQFLKQLTGNWPRQERIPLTVSKKGLQLEIQFAKKEFLLDMKGARDGFIMINQQKIRGEDFVSLQHLTRYLQKHQEKFIARHSSLTSWLLPQAEAFLQIPWVLWTVAAGGTLAGGIGIWAHDKTRESYHNGAHIAELLTKYGLGIDANQKMQQVLCESDGAESGAAVVKTKVNKQNLKTQWTEEIPYRARWRKQKVSLNPLAGAHRTEVSFVQVMTAPASKAPTVWTYHYQPAMILEAENQESISIARKTLTLYQVCIERGSACDNRDDLERLLCAEPWFPQQICSEPISSSPKRDCWNRPSCTPNGSLSGEERKALAWMAAHYKGNFLKGNHLQVLALSAECCMQGDQGECLEALRRRKLSPASRGSQPTPSVDGQEAVAQ